jgi:nicotine blue oxidoreductase
VVTAANWDQGMGTSLRAGLAALDSTDAQIACVHLVDLPDVGSDVVARLLTSAVGVDPGPRDLRERPGSSGAARSRALAGRTDRRAGRHRSA